MSRKALFQPVADLGLDHRIFMAPMTRVRGTETFCCGPTAAQYYAERSSYGGMLITEGTPISPVTQYEYAASIYTDEQEEAWKIVSDAVHAQGGKLSMQLWHLGRMSHASWGENAFLKSLNRPLPSVSPSATVAPGKVRNVKSERGIPLTAARAMTKDEICVDLVNDFVDATRRAKRAGLDMVEVHAAHGYLFDQFFCDSTNLRTDEFGCQSIENRTRALKLVLEAVIKEMGSSKRVGIRISPTQKDTFSFQGCKDSNPEDTYRGVIEFLNQFDLGYLLITEPRWNGGRDNMHLETDKTFAMPVRNGWVKSIYKGFVIGSSSFTPQAAEEAVENGVYDAIAFGRLFISNPDLVDRIRNNEELNVFNTKTFYVRDNVKGYIDYPRFEEARETGYRMIAEEDIGNSSPPPADAAKL